MKNLILTLLATALGLIAMAQVGTIENITVEQRTDGSGMVDISFDLMSPDTAQYNISIEASFDGGDTYTTVGSEYLSGDITEISPATGLEIVWDGMASHPEVYSEETILKIVATLVDDTEVVEVLNPTTGKTWMDRNLGATRAATSSTDAEAYGDLYQWGRAADGHQKRTSGTTSTLSNSDTPGHGNFITNSTSYRDWRSPQNNNLWQGVNGNNNPCPAGYRLPTEAELNAERSSWSSNNSAGAFASPLKLPVAGSRYYSNGSLSSVGSNGRYWSGTVGGASSHYLYFGSSYDAVSGSGYRAGGLSVRCLKESGQSIYNVINPTTGKTWMDRNLGATRAATSSTDAEAYGDLYQWGRAADGHQKRTSGTTYPLSNSDTPGHGNFILAPNSPYDWRSPQNANLWQGVNGINNPCPGGYRLPTEAELNAERSSWSSNNSAGAFASPLKLPVAGRRRFQNGSLFDVGSSGGYWSSTVEGSYSRFLHFDSYDAYMFAHYRAGGLSVRCLKESGQSTYNVILNVSPEGTGQVTGAGQYPVGTTVTITATPNAGYAFVNWTGDTDYIADASAASTTLTMPAQNITLTANFEEDGGGNGDDTQVVEVLNPATGKTWMDRNLGATRAATSSTDAEAYGDLYQWGRAADGHQKRTSGTTSTLSNSDTPGHGNFILAPNSPYDWRSPQNANLWQGVNGINNPCPGGYRLPTEAELNAERSSWSSNNSAGAFASPLKLPMAGYRGSSAGSLYSVGSGGSYWSSTVAGTYSRYLYFYSGNALMSSYYRANGYSVRCLKE